MFFFIASQVSFSPSVSVFCVFVLYVLSVYLYFLTALTVHYMSVNEKKINNTEAKCTWK